MLSGFVTKSMYMDAFSASSGLMPAWLNPGCAARLAVDGETLGFFGELAPHESQLRKLRQTIFLGEFNLARLFQHALRQPVARELSRFPAVVRDFSFTFPDTVRWQQIAEMLGVARHFGNAKHRTLGDFSRQKRAVRIVCPVVACDFPGAGPYIAPGGTAGVGPPNLLRAHGAWRTAAIPTGVALVRNRISHASSPFCEYRKSTPLSHRNPSKIRLRPNRSAILREEHLTYL